MNLNIYTEGFVKEVTESMINSITKEIRQQVVSDVTAHVMKFDLQAEIKAQIDSAVCHAIQKYVIIDKNGQLQPYHGNSVTNAIFTEFKNHTQIYLESLVDRINENITLDLSHKLASISINELVTEQCQLIVERMLKSTVFKFPDSSIPSRAINTEGIQIKRENLLPGVIKGFESLGIQDYANNVQLTLFDDASVFENKLVVDQLEVNGSIRINGTINSDFVDRVVSQVQFNVLSSYADGTYDHYCDRVFNKIYNQGIQAEVINYENQPLIQGTSLHNKITQSNLQKIGVLKELQVVGESLLDDTLYTFKKKVGINTLSPERALDIWDQEVQVVVCKRLKDVGFVGTLRNQQLILSSNNKNNLILNIDGSITVEQLNIGRISHSSSMDRPTDNRPQGHIVWNEKPALGSPIGWISLGGARWARFGTITE